MPLSAPRQGLRRRRKSREGRKGTAVAQIQQCLPQGVSTLQTTGLPGAQQFQVRIAPNQEPPASDRGQPLFSSAFVEDNPVAICLVIDRN